MHENVSILRLAHPHRAQTIYLAKHTENIDNRINILAAIRILLLLYIPRIADGDTFIRLNQTNMRSALSKIV